MWRQHEVFDGTYDFDDLLDAHEIIFVKAENAAQCQRRCRKELASGRKFNRRISCRHWR
ncbi:MAG: DUF6889 family protein [Dialister invisus]|uniref:DUF6889 family protein n=1 Tax=Dialister invisus TaxID=218538 RepID=UPI003999A3A6